MFTKTQIAAISFPLFLGLLTIFKLVGLMPITWGGVIFIPVMCTVLLVLLGVVSDTKNL